MDQVTAIRDEVFACAANAVMAAGVHLDAQQTQAMKARLEETQLAERLAALIPGDERRVVVEGALQHAVGAKYDLRDGSGEMVVKIAVKPESLNDLLSIGAGLVVLTGFKADDQLEFDGTQDERN